MHFLMCCPEPFVLSLYFLVFSVLNMYFSNNCDFKTTFTLLQETHLPASGFIVRDFHFQRRQCCRC